MIKVIIFDLNGVFIKSELLSDRFKKDFQVDETEFRAALSKIMPLVRLPKAPPCFSLWKPYLQRWKIKLKEQEFFEYWFSGEHLVQEIINFVKDLKKKRIRIFILSNNFKERTAYYKKNFPEIFQNADKAYFSWETGYVKPDERAFRHILEEFDLKPEECLYFDDSEKNIEAARKIGIQAELFKDVFSLKKE